MKKVSIVSVNYNQPQVTIEFLRSLKEQEYKNLEVILVDNAPKEDFSSKFIKEYPGLIYLHSHQNLGFAGGNNLGIRKATGDYFFFLNNDTEVPSNTIEKLVESLDEIPNAGIICPLIYYYDQKDMLQYAGYSDINYLTGRNSTIGKFKNWSLSNTIKLTGYPHGAAMMVTRKVIEEVGHMPEHFFLYYEEIDWASQIKHLGYKCWVDHRARIFHKESISTGQNSTLKTYFLTRNRILFMRRNASKIKQIAFFLFFFLVSVPKNLMGMLLKKQWDHAIAFMAGIHWNLTNNVESKKLGFQFNHLNQTNHDAAKSSQLGKAA